MYTLEAHINFSTDFDATWYSQGFKLKRDAIKKAEEFTGMKNGESLVIFRDNYTDAVLVWSKHF